MSHTILISNYDYPGLVAGFEKLGHRVIAGNDHNWWLYRDQHPKVCGEHLRNVVRRENVDVLIIGKGLDSNTPRADVSPPYWHIPVDDLLEIRNRGVVNVLLDLDSPDSFPWITQTGLVGSCDVIGTCCIGAKKDLERWTDGNVVEFWPAWDQVQRQPPVVQTQWDSDLILIGTPYLAPNPEFGIPRRDVVRTARELGLSVVIYGPEDWIRPDFGDESFADCYRGVAPFHALHYLMAASKITYDSFLRRGFRYINDRLPIAGGAGAFLVCEEQLGLEEEFRQDIHIGWHRYRDRDSLRQALEWWSSHDAERTQCAIAMQRHILEHHTYEARAVSLCEAIDAAHRVNRSKGKRCCR